jgi:hypothetical protein
LHPSFTVCLLILYRIRVSGFGCSINALNGGFDLLFPKVLFPEAGLLFQEWTEALIDFENAAERAASERQPIRAARAAQHTGAVAREQAGGATV